VSMFASRNRRISGGISLSAIVGNPCGAHVPPGV
jgi:hypothetical protein